MPGWLKQQIAERAKVSERSENAEMVYLLKMGLWIDRGIREAMREMLEQPPPE